LEERIVAGRFPSTQSSASQMSVFAMLSANSALAFLALMTVVRGGWDCPTGYADNGETPLCVGHTSSTCSLASCCKLTGALCSAAGVISGNAKCKTGTDVNYFYDLHKNAAVAASDSDADFVASCCSQCSAATCADWQPAKLLVSCGSGKELKGTNTLASADCTIPTNTAYTTACCIDTPTLCSGTGAISGNLKCKTGTDVNYFFDLHKATAVVASASDGDFRASCCSQCSAATCADWQPVKLLTSCGAGLAVEGTKTLASADCSVPTDDAYKTACCTTPMKCADAEMDVDHATTGTLSSVIAVVGIVAALMG